MKKYIVDAAHSDISFKVRHLMVSNVKGTFTSFAGSVESEDEFLTGKINFEIDTNSISTKDENRDGHIKGADFLDVENFPKITFVSNEFSSGNFVVSGLLTIKGVTKEVNFACDFNGKSVDPWGNTKYGFEVSGKINRSDFGVTWNAPLETGGVLLSDEIQLTVDVQLIEQP